MSRRKVRAEGARRSAVPARASGGQIGPVWNSLGLVALNLFVYAQVRGFGFVNWDDPSYLTENPHVAGGLTWTSAWWALTTGYSPYWHPMTWLSHLLDVRLFGMDAGAHHVTNALLHAATTVLVFVALRRMTAEAGPSAFVAAMFAVHPLHVESVAWIAERKDVLSTFLWALAVWAYIGYTRRPAWGRYLAVVLSFGLALMAKPMVVTLPAVLLLLDVWPLRRVRVTRADLPAWRHSLLEKAPLVALAAAASVATVIVQHRVGAMAGLDALPWRLRAANATVACVEYLWKAVWPTHLAAFYPYHTYAWWQVLGAALLILLLTAAAARARHDRPYLLVGWVWYLVVLAPVIGLLQAGEQRVADRFMYVPLIGLSIVAAWGARDLLAAWPPGPRRRALAAAAVSLVAIGAITARAQASYWTDSVTLWEHAARVTPDSYIAFENLGQALRERGRLEEALARYRQALALAPAHSPAYRAVIHNSLGLVLTRQGQDGEAAAQFEAAARLDHGFAEAWSNLGNARAAAGRFGEAIEHYAAAVRIKPEFTEALLGLGSALLSGQRGEEAETAYARALRVDPHLAQAHNGLGASLALRGQDDRALAEYNEALRLDPELATAHFNLAVLLVKRDDLPAARRHLEAALSSDPAYGPALTLRRRLQGR